jgi:hypothetical protein
MRRRAEPKLPRQRALVCRKGTLAIFCYKHSSYESLPTNSQGDDITTRCDLRYGLNPRRVM